MAGLMLAGSAPAAWAQSYPSKPLTLVVGYAPGGATDILARTLAEKLQARLGQNVLVDNRPGGSTVIASNFVRQSPPDGYTLYVVTSQFGQMPVVSPGTAHYDPLGDFTPIAQTNSLLMVLVAHPSLPFNNMKEMIEYARRNPGKLNVATTGIGSTDHLGGELLGYRTGTKFNFVPYKGAAPAVQDVIAGVADIRQDAMASSRAHIESGRLKAIAVMETRRNPGFPNIPAVAETLPDAAWGGYFGVVGPKDLPRNVVDRLNQELMQIMRMPDVAEKLTKLGMDPAPGTPEQFASVIRTDNTQWGKLLKDTGLKIEQ